VKAVFWDLGDTLVEMDNKLKEKIVKKICNRCNVKIDLAFYDREVKEEWKRRESQPELERIKRIRDSQMEKEYWIEFYTCILEKIENRHRYPDLVQWLAKVQSNYRSFVPIAGIKFILLELAELRKSGIKTGVISNAFPSAKRILGGC
jgi:FMN phosphatase YigB (HAD superfamily)